MGFLKKASTLCLPCWDLVKIQIRVNFGILSSSLSGPISHDIAILSLRYPISSDTFSGRLVAPQNGAIPPLGN